LTRSNFLLSLLSSTVFFLLLEGLGSALMSARGAKGTLYMQEESHSRYDSDLGWSHRPGLRLEGVYGPGTRFTTNAQGFRAREAYAKGVPPGRYRVVCVGDSFTMGFGVGDESSYPAQMEALCPAVQAVNMGQGGYGVDQEYLWYKRDGVKLDAQVLLLAVVAHDFYRMAGDSFIGYAKPVLRVRGRALVVDNVPVPRTWGVRTPLRRARAFVEGLGVVRTGRWLVGKVRKGGGLAAPEEFYGVVDDAVFASAGMALDDLAAISRARGQHLVLVYLPSSDLLGREPTREAAWLEEYGRRSGVTFVNLVPEFGRRPPWEIAALFRPDYHYTVEGNRFVAGALLRRLRERIPGFPGCDAARAAPSQDGSHRRSRDS
jgi:hypothetical protein